MSNVNVADITAKPLISFHRHKEKWRARIEITNPDASYRLSIGMYANKQVAYEAAVMAAEVFELNGAYLTDSDIHDIKRHFVNIDRRSEATPRVPRIRR